MKTILHKADTRGHANHGWLNSFHSFSFANYYNPDRMNFGVLRVLNDDTVAAGQGFGVHPHNNMEIVSIPLEGDLEHRDSMGNKAVIKSGDVQVMSAGTGITHSEYNYSAEKPVKFLQIWLLPERQNVSPRYDQITLNEEQLQNTFYQVLSPHEGDQGVWVHQRAWFHIGHLQKDVAQAYAFKEEANGLYVFVLEGSVEVAGHALGRRDGLGIWETAELTFKALENTKLLLMEVPMQLP